MRKEKYARKYPPIIAIDFDGTISKYTFGRFNYLLRNFGEGSIEISNDWVNIIKALHQKGAELILYTCREGYYLDMAECVLDYYGILHCFGSINSNTEKQLIRFDAVTQPRKPIADFYIDDLSGAGTRTRENLLDDLRYIYFTDIYLNKFFKEENNE